MAGQFVYSMFSLLLACIDLAVYFFTLPPPEADISDYGKWGKHQVNNTGIHAQRWLFALLHSRFSTNGALSICYLNASNKHA